MSIPRFAIHRPVSMFMLSAVIVLLGGISLARLPVDLMPDVTYPTITVRVSYGGVAPAEIEQLIVRPLEQTLAAVPGLDQINSTASEGSGQVRLSFAWGTDLNEAADEIRTRVDRVRGRLPEEADAPNISKFDASASPIMGIGIEGDFDRVTLREMAETDIAPRLERVEGVAAVTVSGGLRRQIHIELSKEKIIALDLAVDRVVNTIRSENQNVPLGELTEGDTSYLLRSQGEFQSLDQIRDLVIQTKGGVPVYLRDIAEITDTTEDLRSFTRINGKPGVRLQVSKQSGKNTVAIAEARPRGNRPHQPRRAQRPPHAARRPGQIHRAVDRRREGSGVLRRVPGRGDHLHLPQEPAVHVHHLPRRSRFRSSARSACCISRDSR